jgi:polygalacturonase
MTKTISVILALCCTWAATTAQAAGEKEFNILKYGAKPDGVTFNTQAIQSAVDAATKAGGGRVVIPEGRFLTGRLELKSNVHLHLEKGAVMLGSTNPYDYYPDPAATQAVPLISCNNATRVSITGEGTVDGQGRALALNVDSLYYAGKIDAKNYDTPSRRPRESTRPVLISFNGCREVLLQDFNIHNGAMHVVYIAQCEDVTVERTRLVSNAYANNDGYDIFGSRNVRMTNCFIDCADDGICLKWPISYDITVENCTIRSNASAVKFGSGAAAKGVTFRNIEVYDTYRSAIALESVDGGLMEDILFDGVTVRNSWNVFFLRLGHRNTDGDVGTLKNVVIRNVRAQVAWERPDMAYEMRHPGYSYPFHHNICPASITGIPGYYVENVLLENIDITYPGRGDAGTAYIPLYRLKDMPEYEHFYPEYNMFGEFPAWGLYTRHAKGITLKNVSIRAEKKDYRPAYVFDDVTQVVMEGIRIEEADDDGPQIILKDAAETRLNVDRKWIKTVD